MRRIEASVEIDAPVLEVFTFASDWQRWEDWWEGVSNFQPTTEVTRGNGARYACKAWMAGMKFNVETEIREFRENVCWIGVATKGIPHRTQWVFEAKKDKTRFTYILEYDLRWPVLSSILDPLLVRPGWQRILGHSFRNLRLHFESRRQ